MGVLVAYIAALPLYRVGLVTVGTKMVVPSDVLFVLLLVAATAAKAWRRPSSGLVVVAALPPAATAAVALLGNAPSAAATTEVLRTAYSMATLLTLASLDLGREQQRLAARAWTLTGAVVCVIGLTALAAVVFLGAPVNPFARPNSPNLGPNVVRVSGVLETNALTLYLVITSAFATYLARQGEQVRERPAATAALLLMGFTTLVAISRGAVGFLCSMTLLAARDDLAPHWLRRRRVVVGSAAAMLLILGFAATRWAVFPVSLQRDPQGRRSIGWNHRPNAYRVLHTAGLRMFAAQPLFGVGQAGFGARLADFTSPEERAGARPPVDLGKEWSPHSTWIGLAAQGGIVLLTGWVAFSFAVARWLLRGQATTPLAPYVGLALLGLFLNGLHVDFEHLKFVWAAAGIGLGERHRDSGQEPSPVA